MKKLKTIPKCPFLVTNKFCTHKSNPFSSHRKVCGYKNHLNCELFLEWQEKLHLNEKSPPERFKIDTGTILDDT